MKRAISLKILLIWLIATISGCSPDRSRSKEVASLSVEWLKEVEEKLYSTPKEALVQIDSLRSLIESTVDWERGDNETIELAHLQLLEVIAKEQLYGHAPHYPLLTLATQYFERVGDNHNLTRAILYRSIGGIQSGELSSIQLEAIQEAESLFNKKGVEDDNLGAKIYLYLAQVARKNSNYSMAKVALDRAKEYSEKANNVNTFNLSQLELFTIALTGKKYGEALVAIGNIKEEDQLPPHIKYRLSIALYNYHASRGEHKIAIEYLYRVIAIAEERGDELDINYPKKYYLLSNQYRRLEEFEKERYYLHKAVEVADRLEEESRGNTHYYYRTLAALLQEEGSYQEAASLYEKAYYAYLRFYSRRVYQKAKEFQSHLTQDKVNQVREIVMREESKKRSFLRLTSLLLFISLIVVSYLLTVKRREYKIREEYYQKTRREQKKNWLLAQLFSSTAPIYSDISDTISKEAGKLRKLSHNSFNILNKALNQASVSSRTGLSEIVNSQQFRDLFADDEIFEVLTDFEKMVYLLEQNNFTIGEVAAFLNSSPSSIRTIKSRISKKIRENGGSSTS